MFNFVLNWLKYGNQFLKCVQLFLRMGKQYLENWFSFIMLPFTLLSEFNIWVTSFSCAVSVTATTPHCRLKFCFYFEYVCLAFLWLSECTQVPRQKAEEDGENSKVRKLVKHFLLNCTHRPLNPFSTMYLPLSTPEISFA